MRVVADTNIPFVKEAFREFGSVITVPGREITRKIVKNASILLVRSVTKVDRDLIEGTGVKFVGTATIGFDHIDTEYLSENGVGFASAPGSNAESVAEYVICAIADLAKRKRLNLAEMKLGIVGVGNVGSRVLRLARVLGISCLLNDPPKQRATGSGSLLPIDKVLSESDIVTLHVPLSKNGQDPTFRMVDEYFLGGMKKKAILINTSRGGVVNEKHLSIKRVSLGGVVLDVWENEPAINPETISIADIATPHIAGYSYDGKVRGAGMIYDAACSFFFREKKWDLRRVIESEQGGTIDLTKSKDPLYDALIGAYPIMDDDASTRSIRRLDDGERGKAFDELRKNYRKRLEIPHFKVVCGDPEYETLLSRLGFKPVNK